MGRLLARVTRPTTQAQVRRVGPVAPAAATDLVARVYAQVVRDFGVLAPPVSLHAPAPDALAAAWLMLRETLLAAGPAGRAAKEAVAAGVSVGNACGYCVDVHGTALHGLVRTGDAEAIAEDRIGAVADPYLRRLARWARASGRRADAARYRPPFPAAHAPELVGTAVTLHYLNRMVTLFLTASPLPPRLPATARRAVTRVVGRALRPLLQRARVPGAALPLLPAAPLPADLSWATGAAHVAEAFARAAATIDRSCGGAVPAAVRELLAAELAGWDGTARGPSRAWVERPVAGLPVGDRAAGRLALLTAIAPYQVTDSTVDEFRRDHPGDRALVELTSWASFAAARRIGTWL
jgi:AhpD family alkylhydroperoxidase